MRDLWVVGFLIGLMVLAALTLSRDHDEIG